jgi:hypothetical protein
LRALNILKDCYAYSRLNMQFICSSSVVLEKIESTFPRGVVLPQISLYGKKAEG